MKRPRDPEQRTSSPVKRPRKDSFPATPYTPYPQQPSDSPSNPFKRKTRVDSLPLISSFRKHIPLRFQFHRCGLGFRKGGVHRIVQVPLNYSFTHLRALIAWLFDVPAKSSNGKAGEEDYLFEVKTNTTMESMHSKPGMIKCGETPVKLSNSKDPSRRRFATDADDQDELERDQNEDEFRENLDDDSGDWVWADEEDYTLGHVWVTGLQADRGIIYVKWSLLFPRSFFDLFSHLQHHYPSTQVHITVNTTKLPRRRGKSNVPYIFFARGRAHLSQRPLPRPLFTQSILHTLSSSPAGPSRLGSYAPGTIRRPNKKHNKTNHIDDDLFGDGNESLKFFNKKHPFFDRPSGVSLLNVKTRRNRPTILVSDTDEDDEDEAYDCHIDPVHWNRSHYAFGRYFLSFVDPRGRSYAHLDDEYFEEKIPYDPFENDDEEGEGEAYVEEGSMEVDDGLRCSTPGLTRSSSRCGSSLPPSSPAPEVSSSPALQHSITFDDDDGPTSIDPLSLSPNSSLELHPSIIASHYPNKKYTFTPAPPIARKHRLQLERMERRIEKGKMGTYLCEYDEVVDDEVDELFGEEDEYIDDEGNGKWERPVLEEGEVWDPFGDEEEI